MTIEKIELGAACTEEDRVALEKIVDELNADKSMPCPRLGRCSAKKCPLKGNGIPYILTTFDGTPCKRQFG